MKKKSTELHLNMNDRQLFDTVVAWCD